MNELSLIFDKVGISTRDVLEAAGTKWNFHKYTPGLVGGHCIGVDPYYLTYKAMELGHHPEVILAGRKINDNMYKHIIDLVIRELNHAGKVLQNSKVLVLGLSFKENVKDYRNSKSLDVIQELQSYGINVIGYDPLLGKEIVDQEFKVPYQTFDEVRDIDGVVVISPHEIFRGFNFNQLHTSQSKFLIDVKAVFDQNNLKDYNYKAL